MRVLCAGLDHLDALVPLFDGYREFYHQSSDPEAAHAFLRERIEQKESVIFLALDAEERGLGFTQLYPSFSSVSTRRLWILNDLYVASEARRKGVATALLTRARQHAMETGAKGVVLETAVDNHAAHALYESLGWRRNTEFCTYLLNV